MGIVMCETTMGAGVFFTYFGQVFEKGESLLQGNANLYSWRKTDRNTRSVHHTSMSASRTCHMCLNILLCFHEDEIQNHGDFQGVDRI